MDTRIIWIDMEMTGLDIENDFILEISAIITDANLKVVAEMPTMIIHQSRSILDGMCEWCMTTHTKSGLVQACLDSTLTIEEADKTLINFLMEHTPVKKCPLAGNSVYNDKRFMEKFMPQTFNHLNYRIIDVSSFSEVMHRWLPVIQSEQPKKKLGHRALDDIKESIAQLSFYKERIFDMHKQCE